MAEFDDIQTLIRLKRYEMPPDGFVDEFMTSFHERQRAELLKRSATSLVWERLLTYFEGRPNAGVAMAGAVALVALGAVAMWPISSAQRSDGLVKVNKSNVTLDVNAMAMDAITPYVMEPDLPSNESPLLMSKHFAGGYADEARSNPIQEPRQSEPLQVIPQLGITVDEK